MSKIFSTASTCNYCSVNRFCLPSALPKDDLNHLDKLINQRIELKPGEYLFHANEPFQFLYAIRFGSLKSFIIRPEGLLQITDFYFPGNLVGFEAISKNKYTFSCVALEATSLCQISFENLLVTARIIPKMQYFLMLLMSTELCKQTVITQNVTAMQRVAKFLVTLMEQYHAHSNDTVMLNIKRNEIANYLGLATETVSRIFSKLDEENILLVKHRKISVINPELLKEYADGLQSP